MIGISVDSVWANKAFADQLHLELPLLSDAKRTVARAYGVYDDANDVARRTTFVIDADGIVRHITQSSEALDPNAAIGACPLPKKR